MSNNYESFRSDLLSKLADLLPSDQLSDAITLIDKVSTSYDISLKSTDIIVTNDIPPVVGYYLASKALESLSKTTLTGYKQEIARFFTKVKKPYDKVTTSDIRLYLAEYKSIGKACDRTIDLYRRILNSFFEWLVKNEYLTRNPCAAICSIKYQATPREPLSPYNLEILRAHCVTPREKAMVDFLFSTGCRVSECSDVKLTDINWDERSVIVRHGKGNKRRVVYFNPEAEVSMKIYIDSRKDDCDVLFLRTRGGIGPMSARSIENALHKIRIRSGIDQACTPHILRHTFATAGLKSGIPLEKLQALLGHSKPETTLIYAQLDNTDIKYSYNRAFI